MSGGTVPRRGVPGRGVPGRGEPGRGVPGRGVPGRGVPVPKTQDILTESFTTLVNSEDENRMTTATKNKWLNPDIYRSDLL